MMPPVHADDDDNDDDDDDDDDNGIGGKIVIEERSRSRARELACSVSSIRK